MSLTWGYDALGRMLEQKEIYQKWYLNVEHQWEKEWVTIPIRTLCYDTLGNIASETNAMGNTKSCQKCTTYRNIRRFIYGMFKLKENYDSR